MMCRRDGVIFMILHDSYWGEVKIAKILPSNTSNWGAYEFLSQTEDGLLIPEIDPETLDRASRGDCTPFLNSGLRDPKGCLKKLSLDTKCDDQEGCLSFNLKRCILGNKKMPDCFNPISTPALRPLVLAWLEGYYIIREGS